MTENGAGWAREISERVGAEIKRVREAKSPKWSAQRLSDETERLGHRVSRETIANLENGRKSTVDVADIVMLAFALGLAPVQLIYPGVPDAWVQIRPGERTRAMYAVQWFSGEEVHQSFNLDTSHNPPRPMWDEAAHKVLVTSRRREQLNYELTALLLDIDDPKVGEAIREKYLTEYQQRRAELGRLTLELGAEPLYRDPPRRSPGSANG